MPALRRLTDLGLQEASAALARVRSGESAAIDQARFADPALSEATNIQLPAWDTDLKKSRWHLAIWLYRALEGQEASMTPGAWSWLAVHLFDVICPERDGKRTVREDARYLLQAGDYRKAHRHLVAGPYLLFTAHGDDPGAIRGLLATTPEAPGEVYEQLATRKFLITSRAVVTVATRMYYDPESGKLRRGSGGSGGGSPRRFMEVLQQFDRTYDMQAMSPVTLLALLPGEFRRFTNPS